MYTNYLNQLFRLDGIFIFVTAISQQGLKSLNEIEVILKFYLIFQRNHHNAQQFISDEIHNISPDDVCLSHFPILLRQHYELNFANEI
jgi:hypothetical protein